MAACLSTFAAMAGQAQTRAVNARMASGKRGDLIMVVWIPGSGVHFHDNGMAYPRRTPGPRIQSTDRHDNGDLQGWQISCSEKVKLPFGCGENTAIVTVSSQARPVQ